MKRLMVAAVVSLPMGDGVRKPVPLVAEPTGLIRPKDTVWAKNPAVCRMKHGRPWQWSIMEEIK